jgi:hypothetical protein
MDKTYPYLTGGPLARTVLSIIQDNQQRWDQSAWRHDRGTDVITYCTTPTTAIEAFPEDPLNPACTTSFCFAGWVAALDGVRWAKGGNGMSIGNPAVCDCTTFCCEKPEHQMTVDRYAAARLGIDDADACALFASANTLDELVAGVEAIEGGYGVREAFRRVMDGDDDWDDDEDEEEMVDA